MTSSAIRPRARLAAAVVMLGSAAILLGACSTSSASSGESGSENSQISPLSPARHLGPQGQVGQFVTDCGYSHSAPDDPIVFPGQPGMSHEHDFFGNTSTNADSTTQSLLKADTTCQKQRDTAAYWAPQLRDHGEAVTPVKSVAYYRAAPGVEPKLVVPYPEGLHIIAGDMTATEPLSADLAGWACGVSSSHDATPPQCPDSAPLRAVMTFPDCWDGVNADSKNHKSHMANSSEGLCPSTHPVHVPQLTFAVAYPISGTGHDLTLASGSTYGIHADFINAWDQAGLAKEIKLCVNRDVVCGLSSNRDEDPLFGPK
ncbi:unannotated protein [freshwater metagenome]|uniref:Unannotated protein n=1 Tax=freshwater metagenome TaxID=449393 RepID=A0A6J6BBE5_9ZZZZ|nr:DUF1996 domain-containing protein [Actinomycetota bacterium]